MPNRRRFIDKKKSITFQLVHRSQHDPLIVDETIGERVLVPLSAEQRKIEQKKFGIEFDDDYDYLRHLKDPCAPPERYTMQMDAEEEDVEDYEDIDEEDENNQDSTENQQSNENLIDRFQLPSTVFESKTTNEIGMLNLAAPDTDPKIHWDPDVIAALDDDEFDYDNEQNALDDDFMLKANGTQPLEDEECDEFEDEIVDESSSTKVPPLFIPKSNKPIPLALQRFLNIDDDDNNDEMRSNYSADADEDHDGKTSKTKYTNYSMTSSVIRRNQGLQNVDEHFDKFFDEYDDEQIGSLDSYKVNPNGIPIDNHLIEQTMEQFEQHQIQCDEKVHKISIEKTKLIARKLIDQPEETTIIYVEDEEKSRDKWDCETILTTYSNIYNHPKLITLPPKQQIRLSNKSGLPLSNDQKKSKRDTKIKIKQKDSGKNQQPEEKDDQEKKEEEVEEDDDDDDDNDDGEEEDLHRQSNSRLKISFERKKGETSEERRARKHAVKEYRRDRRLIKKATKVAFKQEEQKQIHEHALHAAQTHLQSLRVV